MLGRLNELVIVVVQHAQHARPARLAETDQAALRQRRLFGTFIRCIARHVGLEALHLLLHDRLRVLVRDLPVGRLDDVRGAPLALHLGQTLAGSHPEAVIALEAEVRSALRRRALVRVGIGCAEFRVIRRNAREARVVDDLLCLLVIDDELGLALRTRERRQRRVGPDAGQIRLAIRSARNLSQGGRAHRDDKRNESRSDGPHEFLLCPRPAM